mmetsp:Transcript_4602/g.16392  ORF Transcript_4602/g.16392 Transcript_4602/m.16392 type:complete len:262 (+) Transcript_4602:2044-2829(+)
MRRRQGEGDELVVVQRRHVRFPRQQLRFRRFRSFTVPSHLGRVPGFVHRQRRVLRRLGRGMLQKIVEKVKGRGLRAARVAQRVADVREQTADVEAFGAAGVQTPRRARARRRRGAGALGRPRLAPVRLWLWRQRHHARQRGAVERRRPRDARRAAGYEGGEAHGHGHEGRFRRVASRRRRRLGPAVARRPLALWLLVAVAGLVASLRHVLERLDAVADDFRLVKGRPFQTPGPQHLQQILRRLDLMVLHRARRVAHLHDSP